MVGVSLCTALDPMLIELEALSRLRSSLLLLLGRLTVEQARSSEAWPAGLLAELPSPARC